MASITILYGHKNLIFAAMVAEQTGAEFEEKGEEWITISDSPTLTIPHYCFTQAFDPDGQQAHQGDSQLENSWRSMILNKQGYLMYFGDSEIVITDNKPKDKRPQFLLRFPDQESKIEAEEWAERSGFPSLTEYIIEAISAYNQLWSEKAN